MITFFFVILFILGVIQIISYYKQTQRLKRLYDNDFNSKTISFSDKMTGYTLGMALTNLCNDVYRHMKGKNKSDAMKNIFTFLAILTAGLYINNIYFKISCFLFFPFFTIILLYILYLRSKKTARMEFESGFAEALNIINSSVSAGNSLLHAIELSGQKVKGIVGDELKIVSQRLEIGEDIEHVFMDSYKRLFYREYFFFVIAVLINMKGGGEIKEVISRLSKLISNGRIMYRKKYAKTSEPRASIKILIMIPIGFFFFLKFLSPENFDILLNDPTGRIVLYYCIASELFGLFIVWSMMNKI